jgi:hypothetical protein
MLHKRILLVSPIKRTPPIKGREVWDALAQHCRLAGYEVDLLVCTDSAHKYLSQYKEFNRIFHLFRDHDQLVDEYKRHFGNRPDDRPTPEWNLYVEFDRRLHFRGEEFVEDALNRHAEFVRALVGLRKYAIAFAEISSALSLIVRDEVHKAGGSMFTSLFAPVPGRFFLCRADTENPFPSMIAESYNRLVMGIQPAISADERKVATDLIQQFRAKLAMAPVAPKPNASGMNRLREWIRRRRNEWRIKADMKRPLKLGENYWEREFSYRYSDPSIDPWTIQYDAIPVEPYVLYCMQCEPEMSIEVYCPYLKYQLPIIRNIVASLPFGTKLVVKEHPLNGPRTREFYDAIRKITQVRYIAPEVDSRILLKSAKAIVTITGTVGWESTILGKPLFLLGKKSVPYHVIEGIHLFSTWEAFADKFRATLSGKETAVYDEESLIRYLVAVLRSTVVGKAIKPTVRKSDVKTIITNEAQTSKSSFVEDFDSIANEDNMHELCASYAQVFDRELKKLGMDG